MLLIVTIEIVGFIVVAAAFGVVSVLVMLLVFRWRERVNNWDVIVIIATLFIFFIDVGNNVDFIAVEVVVADGNVITLILPKPFAVFAV